ncbi:MAG: hypothetical protein HGA45_03690 [Chloroflexales bacterium]|nr:hypothetical protein [Chloroflexales bacterium]
MTWRRQHTQGTPSTLLRTFRDGSVLAFGAGRFDSWCVYLTRPDRATYPPKDVDYFTQLRSLAERYGAERLYADFLAIYHRTTKEVSPHVLEMIYHMAKAYGADDLEVDILLSILYAGMVAEENKRRAKLRKRVKRLGVHQVLFEDLNPAEAATFSKGKPWDVIELECAVRGF